MSSGIATTILALWFEYKLAPLQQRAYQLFSAYITLFGHHNSFLSSKTAARRGTTVHGSHNQLHDTFATLKKTYHSDFEKQRSWALIFADDAIFTQ